MHQTGYYVSDLHMFARRSQSHRYLDAINSAVMDADLFVLGGDIFDFRWTTLDSVRETVDGAVGWLSELVETNSACQIHYVLGNHDDNDLLMDRLVRLAERYDNFDWYRYYFRVQDKLFLHGDVADRTMDHAALVARRASLESGATRNVSSHLAYDLAIRAGLHKVPSYVWHSPKRVAGRIVNYLDSIEHGPDNGVRHVYFGHTHRALSNFSCEDLFFHNGGAPIRGLPFEILRFVV